MPAHHTRFPHVRASLAEQFTEFSDAEIDELVRDNFGPEVSAEAIESFWKDLGRGFSQAGKTLGRALPSMAQGAMTGASVGGPWGALAGAVAGGAGGIMSQSSNKTLRGIGSTIGTVGNLAGSLRGGGAGGLPAGLGQLLGAGRQAGAGASPLANIGQLLGGGGGANTLLGMLSRPETLQALMSSGMGKLGRSRVMVGNQPVGVQSILGALGTLAGRAASEAAETNDKSLPPFFFGADGELAIDPADSDQRTNALLTLFALSLPRMLAGQDPPQQEWEEIDEWDPDSREAAIEAWSEMEAEWQPEVEEFHA